MRTDALESLAALTAQLLPEEVVDIAALKEEVFDYDHKGWGRDYVGYFDLKQLMEQVLEPLPTGAPRPRTTPSLSACSPWRVPTASPTTSPAAALSAMRPTVL